MSIKQLVNSHEVYTAFQDYLGNKISSLQNSLETAKEPEQIYRLQGGILALRRLQKLREEVLATER